ncbi:unnamed protein product [Linum trigynum]|uniref:Uncharacterized protein n=1 Tax=Linum trigynum TaxID=586398 RepID=A0AAV2DXJ8_9ROSI
MRFCPLCDHCSVMDAPNDGRLRVDETPPGDRLLQMTGCLPVMDAPEWTGPLLVPTMRFAPCAVIVFASLFSIRGLELELLSCLRFPH